ncbi:MAG TPA: PepSY domain-containing protein [Kiritimatiellia bacterium]|nr:PepSY domain-containing protein [Kiritimatiellia bacterium]HMP00577.1 PepSY domain-containing protein [Kiritimatiellia bacterium]
MKYRIFLYTPIVAVIILLSWLNNAVGTEAHVIRFDSVSTNTAANIYVTITPESSTNAVVLEISTLSGVGNAVFMPSSTSNATIYASTNLLLQGVTVSSLTSNMMLTAKLGTNVLDNDIFTVVNIDMISPSQAIAIAQSTIQDTVELDSGGAITAVLSGATYIVTFATVLPEDTLGPDYTAEVTIDAFTGEVVRVLAGS